MREIGLVSAMNSIIEYCGISSNSIKIEVTKDGLLISGKCITPGCETIPTLRIYDHKNAEIIDDNSREVIYQGSPRKVGIEYSFILHSSRLGKPYYLRDTVEGLNLSKEDMLDRSDMIDNLISLLKEERNREEYVHMGDEDLYRLIVKRWKELYPTTDFKLVKEEIESIAFMTRYKPMY